SSSDSLAWAGAIRSKDLARGLAAIFALGDEKVGAFPEPAGTKVNPNVSDVALVGHLKQAMTGAIPTGIIQVGHHLEDIENHGSKLYWRGNHFVIDSVDLVGHVVA